jgi:hypothetical protein
VLDARLAVGRTGGELYLVAACSDAGVHGMACALPVPAAGVGAPLTGGEAQPHRGLEAEAGAATGVDPLSVSESPRGELPAMPPPVPSDDDGDDGGGDDEEEEDTGQPSTGGAIAAAAPRRPHTGVNMRAVVAQAAALQLSRGGKPSASSAEESDDWLLGPRQ